MSIVRHIKRKLASVMVAVGVCGILFYVAGRLGLITSTRLVAGDEGPMLLQSTMGMSWTGGVLGVILAAAGIVLLVRGGRSA